MAGRLNAGREEGQEFDLVTNLPEILAGAERSLRLAHEPACSCRRSSLRSSPVMG